MEDKLREISEEIKTVLAGRSNLIDSIVPPILFVTLNATLGFEYAAWGSLTLAIAITALRLIKHQPLQYALGGLAGIAIAILVAWLLGRAEGYFLPGLITGGGTVILCAASALFKRPMVAWTSHLARGWPLDWYWHPKVRPAYSEVTWFWALFFALRLLLQFILFQNQATELLATFEVISGWPATIVLLVISYLYGLWRLEQLKGPSVEEFKQGVEPPWTGQRRGF